MTYVFKKDTGSGHSITFANTSGVIMTYTHLTAKEAALLLQELHRRGYWKGEKP